MIDRLKRRATLAHRSNDTMDASYTVHAWHVGHDSAQGGAFRSTNGNGWTVYGKPAETHRDLTEQGAHDVARSREAAGMVVRTARQTGPCTVDSVCYTPS